MSVLPKHEIEVLPQPYWEDDDRRSRPNKVEHVDDESDIGYDPSMLTTQDTSYKLDFRDGIFVGALLVVVFILATLLFCIIK
jgi:hypothetical protein